MGRCTNLTAGLILGLAVFLTGGTAQGVITRLTPLRAVLKDEQFIFTATVERLDPDKPAVVLKVKDNLKGKAPFDKLAVNLTGDREGKRQQHTAKLLKRLARDLPVVVFVNQAGKRYVAFIYTNGTWFQVI